VVASTNLVYGGPDNASGANAEGGFVFEVWDTTNLLGGVFYDPASAATKSTQSLLAMTAMDTSNLRLTVTAPASGKIMWRVRTQFHGSTTVSAPLLGVLESSTVVARVAPVLSVIDSLAATSCMACEASGVITGVSAGSHTYDAAYAVQVVSGTGGAGLKHGGPDNTTTNDAFGGTAFELWTA
jgi:hypothetical protein